MNKKTKRQLLRSIYNEIRNPLHNIIERLELITQQIAGMSNEQKELIKNAQDSGDILSTLVSKILDIAKFEAGRLELNPERI